MVTVETALYDSGWCLRTTERVPSWRHISEGGFNKRHYSVLSISEEVARAFVLLHHYSRSYPAGRLAYGMFEKHHLVGVAVLGEPMHPRVITKPLPTLTNRTGAELSRVVLLNEVPANAESARCCIACNKSSARSGRNSWRLDHRSAQSAHDPGIAMLHLMRQ